MACAASRFTEQCPTMKCQLCQHDAFEVVSTVDAKSSDELIVSQCTRCSLVQQTPMPTAEELEQFYTHEYRIAYKGTSTPTPKHILRAGKLALDRIAFLQSAPSHPRGDILDIGAGGG